MILIEQLVLVEGLLYAKLCFHIFSFNPIQDPYIAGHIFLILYMKETET